MTQAARILGGFAIVLISAWAVQAEPITEAITLPEVFVRSGPSPEFYPTSKLHKGDTVRVLREDVTGWLSIAPPSESFSWIDTRFVERIGTNAAVVSAPEAQIWVGSRLNKSEPTVSRIKVPKGTQLAVIGNPQRARDGMRLPIMPVAAEIRYIPTDAIRPPTAPPQLAAAPPEQPKPTPAPPPETAAGFRPATSSSTPPAAANTNSLLLQAEDAERAGNLVRAQELWQELADQVRQTDFQMWSRCINRVQFLREQQHPAVVAAPSANSSRPPQRAPADYSYAPDPGYTARLTPPVTAAPSRPPLGQWSDVGRLRRTAFTLTDGRSVFCLEPFGPNQRLMYVAAGPDVNLTPYVERQVYLYGAVVYSGELRNNFMTVVQVRLAR